MKVGLVLGGGGVTGFAWLTGALQAIERELGWSACQADMIVGTSAGALLGALLAADIPVDELTGDTALSTAVGRVHISLGGVPLAGPGSWPLALSTARRPSRYPAAVVVSGWLWRGVVSTTPIQAIVRAYSGERWPEGTDLRTVTMDYRTGRRIVLGGHGAPQVSLPLAVAASCAVPGIYRPVRAGGHQLVDGGICSPSNLDIVMGAGHDLVICLNPMSSLELAMARTPLDRIARVIRREAGRRLGHEAARLRRDGTQVMLLQPSLEDTALMGWNYLSGRRRAAVTARARESIAAALSGLDLPADLATVEV